MSGALIDIYTPTWCAHGSDLATTIFHHLVGGFPGLMSSDVFQSSATDGSIPYSAESHPMSQGANVRLTIIKASKALATNRAVLNPSQWLNLLATFNATPSSGWLVVVPHKCGLMNFLSFPPPAPGGLSSGRLGGRSGYAAAPARDTGRRSMKAAATPSHGFLATLLSGATALRARGACAPSKSVVSACVTSFSQA